MVSSTRAPVACSRYALSGSDSRSILSAAVVGIMLTRSVLSRPPAASEPDFEHADAATARPRTEPETTTEMTVRARRERARLRTAATEYHVRAHPGNAGSSGHCLRRNAISWSSVLV